MVWCFFKKKNNNNVQIEIMTKASTMGSGQRKYFKISLQTSCTDAQKYKYFTISIL